MAVESPPIPRIEARPEFADILREDLEFSTGGDDQADRLNSWFDQLVLQSGLTIQPGALVMLCMMAGIMLAGLVFVIQENLLTTAMSMLLGTVLPIGVVMYLRSRRQKKLLDQMPGMVEELARAARTGRSLEHCFETVAQDTPAPLGQELTLCSRKVNMGVPLPEALRDLPERTGLTSLRVFGMALTVHHQTGGDLVSVLERLARTMRDRILFLGRLRASTTSSRATAAMMLIVPPAVLAFFVFRDPEYLTDLFAAPWGKAATLLAFGLQMVGTIWVFRILKTSQRT